jgi:hypothetical protein
MRKLGVFKIQAELGALACSILLGLDRNHVRLGVVKGHVGYITM